MTVAATPLDSAKVVADAISRIGEIATLPQITVKIIQIVENPKATARDLHDVIRNDPVLSARLLKVVNSAFYGLPGQIGNMDRAIVLLGLSAVKNIAIAASMTHMFNGGPSIEGLSGTQIWKHSIAVAVAARLLTSAQGRPSVEESFLAGLMHDLGLLVERQLFARQLGEVMRRAQSEGANWCALETEVIGADHAAFGMALANKWRFPAHLCTTIGYHHRPMSVAPMNRELPNLIHVADILACRTGIGFTCSTSGEQYDDEMLAALNLTPDAVEDVCAKLPEQVALSESIFAA